MGVSYWSRIHDYLKNCGFGPRTKATKLGECGFIDRNQNQADPWSSPDPNRTNNHHVLVGFGVTQMTRSLVFNKRSTQVVLELVAAESHFQVTPFCPSESACFQSCPTSLSPKSLVSYIFTHSGKISGNLNVRPIVKRNFESSESKFNQYQNVVL